MKATEKIWFNGKFVPWADAKVHVLTHSLHYGSGAFEGIRVYKTENGPAIFHLEKHIERLVYSSESIGMKLPFTKEELIKAVIETVKVNKIESCYLRPLSFYGFGELKVAQIGCPIEVIIAAWPWGAYLGEEETRISVVKTIRIHPQTTVADAKLTGPYVNSMLAAQEAIGKGFTEALQLDYQGNIAEGPGENFFIVKDGIISTPVLGSILPGITRGSIITLARDLGYTVEERSITLAEAQNADECFFTGTAAEVTPIASIDEWKMKFPKGKVTEHIKEEFLKIVHGKNEKYISWLTFVA